MEVTIFATDIDDLRSQLVRYCGVYGAKLPEASSQTEFKFASDESAEVPAAQAEMQEAPAQAVDVPAKKPRAKKAKAEEAAPPAQETAVEKAVEEKPTAQAVISEDDARNALASVNDAHGIGKAREVIVGFGVQRFSELPKEKYAAFISACKAVL